MNERRKALLTLLGTGLLLLAAILLTPSSHAGTDLERGSSSQPTSSAAPLPGE